MAKRPDGIGDLNDEQLSALFEEWVRQGLSNVAARQNRGEVLGDAWMAYLRVGRPDLHERVLGRPLDPSSSGPSGIAVTDMQDLAGFIQWVADNWRGED